MLTHARLGSCLLLAACGGDGLTGPSVPVGPIGPFPPGVTGNVAFSSVVRSVEGRLVETTVHVIDIARRTDRVIFISQNLVVEGLTWAPDGKHLVAQTVGQGTKRELHQLNLAGDDRVIFDGPEDEYHASFGPDGRLAYFGRSSLASSVFIDGQSVYTAPSNRFNNDHCFLSWNPSGDALVLACPLLGLQRLSLNDGSIAQLRVPDSTSILAFREVLKEPAYSPDGTRIAFRRSLIVPMWGSSSTDSREEIWTVTGTGADMTQLTTDCGDSSPAWVPGGAYVAFLRSCGGVRGIYLIPQAGGTPIRVVGLTDDPTAMAWSR